MLDYLGDNLHHIVIEDTAGNVKSVNFHSWQNMRLTPCCMASTSIHKENSYPA